MADQQQAMTSIKQHVINLETILTGISNLPQVPDQSHPITTATPTPPKKKSKHTAPSILSSMKSARALKDAAESKAAAKRASLSALIDTTIDQTSSLLAWENPPKPHQPSSIVTAFNDYHELREQQKARLEEYERRARVLKMKLELARIAIDAMEKEVRGIRGKMEN